jgi:serine/threonine protein kinase
MNYYKMSENLLNLIFDNFKEMGITNIRNIIEIIYEKKKTINLLKDNISILEYHSNTKKYFKNNENIYVIKKFIKSGSYNKVYKISNNINNFDMVLRKQINSDENNMYNSFIDFFIHSFLYFYQKIVFSREKNYYLGRCIIPEIYSIFINEKKEKIIGIMEYYEGTLNDLILNINLDSIKKVKIAFNCIFQLAYYLEALEKSLKFNHNDLKINNIFYKASSRKNIISKELEYEFYISDFGFSRIEIFNEVISYNNKKFVSGKDLYFLIHNIYTFSNDSFIKSEIKFFCKDIIGYFNETITLNKKKWMNIYKEKNKNYNLYEPSNIINNIKNSYFINMIYQKKVKTIKNI